MKVIVDYISLKRVAEDFVAASGKLTDAQGKLVYVSLGGPAAVFDVVTQAFRQLLAAGANSAEPYDLEILNVPNLTAAFPGVTRENSK